MSFYENDHEIRSLLGDDAPQVKKPIFGEVLPPKVGAVAGGAYEGADRYDRELALWSPNSNSVDADILPEKYMLDARTRDVARNDAFVKSGINIHKDSIVGSQFKLNSKPSYEVLGLDDKWAEEFQTEVEAKFTLYAEGLNNWMDASRKMTFTDMIRLAVGVELIAGEVLAVAEYIQDRERPFATCLQMIDTDRLSDPATAWPKNERLRGGILHDANGAPLGYFIRAHHPSDPYGWDVGASQHKYVKVRKPWGRQQVIHLFDTYRPEQSRGVSAMVSALKEMRMTKNFREVELQNAVINATYAASIESELPPAAVFEAMGAGKGEQDIAGAINEYAGAYMSAIAGYAGSGKSAILNGARIPHFYPGTKLQLHPAGSGGARGGVFEQSMLRYIAAALDLSYEQLSRDYSQTNYSSLQGTLNETDKGMKSRKRKTADTLATHGFALWLEEAIAKREITSMPRNAPSFWEGLNREAYTSCDWIGGGRGQIDSLKETQAAVLKLKYNLSTDEYELAKLGLDWRDVYKQRSREAKMRKTLGIETEAEVAAAQNDNMMNAATGAPRQKEAKDEKKNTGADAVGTLGNDFMDAVEQPEEARPTPKVEQ